MNVKSSRHYSSNSRCNESFDSADSLSIRSGKRPVFEENNLKNSLLTQLVASNKSKTNIQILPKEDESLNRENKMNFLSSTNQVKKDKKDFKGQNLINYEKKKNKASLNKNQPTIIPEKSSSTSGQLENNTKITKISELRMSNGFIPPLDDGKSLGKNNSKKIQKLNEKKRQRDNDIQDNCDKGTTFLEKLKKHKKDVSIDTYENSPMETDSQSISFPNKNSDSANIKTPGKFLMPQLTKLSQIKNSHFNSEQNNSSISDINYDPLKNTVNLGDSNKKPSESTNSGGSYYSSLQKMPGIIKKPKTVSKS
jgi:hypothetical protein